MLTLDVGELVRAGDLDKWIINWWGCQPLIKLDHMGWFTQDKGLEIYLWSPPPAEIETYMKMITEERHKRPYVFHTIVICG